jgi:hypothetical protein
MHESEFWMFSEIVWLVALNLCTIQTLIAP